MSKKRVLVTGSNGLCGMALREESVNFPQYDFIFVTRDDADLTSEHQVRTLFYDHKPNYVISTAAKVGGIGANMAMHETFFYENTIMNAHIIHTAANENIEKLFMFSSVCVFPDNLTILEEDKINDGPVYASNYAYGYAKRGVNTHIEAVQDQYGLNNFVSIIPGNIFGKHDMFSLQLGHVLPSLMHRLYLCKRDSQYLKVWGDGKSLREFIYVNDLAKAILNLLASHDLPNKIIISGRREYSIKEVVDMLCQISGFDPENVIWEKDKPNGQRSRPSSKKVIDSLLPNFQYTDIYQGLQTTWQWLCDNYPNVRTEY